MLSSAGKEKGVGRSLDTRSSVFLRNVMDLLERTEYRRCETGEDLEAIFRLRYRSYRLHGFVAESAQGLTRDEMDDAPNAYNFGVFIDSQLVATVRLHQIDRDSPFGPVMKAFGDVMKPRIMRGATCINASMFAADPDLTSEFRALPYVAMRLVVVAYAHYNSTYCAGLIRQEHTAFYRRVFGAHQSGPPRAYPPISIPLMLYEAECAKQFGRTVARFPFFRSTKSEQRLLFDKDGDVPALTVLPTAKYSAIAA
ncbi:N-acyl amino acid synthase FeeM domain-containing protein [Nitratireductor sp. GCM10026969]|uniref:N-acyl amino acid synthase FeeM domain-containing protein n=1 Tax=Nitratireductor sp. GCM10026969 TaxID=3252645 RepID=UPI00360DD825